MPYFTHLGSTLRLSIFDSFVQSLTFGESCYKKPIFWDGFPYIIFIHIHHIWTYLAFSDAAFYASSHSVSFSASYSIKQFPAICHMKSETAFFLCSLMKQNLFGQDFSLELSLMSDLLISLEALSDSIDNLLTLYWHCVNLYVDVSYGRDGDISGKKQPRNWKVLTNASLFQNSDDTTRYNLGS